MFSFASSFLLLHGRFPLLGLLYSLLSSFLVAFCYLAAFGHTSGISIDTPMAFLSIPIRLQRFDTIPSIVESGTRKVCTEWLVFLTREVMAYRRRTDSRAPLPPQRSHRLPLKFAFSLYDHVTQVEILAKHHLCSSNR